ncbi:hypothetical protein JAAARDRAFT_197588 [Jaapia argillacea MUCL 33604]|uniref:Uncharacterized protein n=1 Tax=Jaapia argillacea MUCL 33604 TaxID=933084 RepID=A0A067PDV2_9AGAM|nr:hypothetical protein JAAARDRAFT_197588 [Jaapia argillacea MUCL 33604]
MSKSDGRGRGQRRMGRSLDAYTPTVQRMTTKHTIDKLGNVRRKAVVAKDQPSSSQSNTGESGSPSKAAMAGGSQRAQTILDVNYGINHWDTDEPPPNTRKVAGFLWIFVLSFITFSDPK